MDRRSKVREFLISRRAKVTPEQAGLHVLEGDPRRVPGLRRKEVADLAVLLRRKLEGASISEVARDLAVTERAVKSLGVRERRRPAWSSRVPRRSRARRQAGGWTRHDRRSRPHRARPRRARRDPARDGGRALQGSAI